MGQKEITIRVTVETPDAPPPLEPSSSDIFADVRAAMQRAEELGGPADGHDYFDLMMRIAVEARRRIRTHLATHATPIPAERVDGQVCRACRCPGGDLWRFADGAVRHPGCHFTSDAHLAMPEKSQHHKIDGGILTVGMLRRLIATMPDSTQVLVSASIGHDADDFFNVATAMVPGRDDEESGIAALTLGTASTYDPRQF